ncbi:MAG: hypothetical protein NTX61_12340 [Bacteroidetes bacterium]|nr:hypothetical protein [Bacteroidota bacterium]
MQKILKASPLIILFLYILGFLFFRHPGQNWDRVINSDGKGYYGYLPAIFIYHDLQFNFIDQYEDKYYPPDKLVFKEFRVKAYGGNVDKCFAGLAIVWLPFFLAGHLLSYIIGYETDGYSIMYQYSIAVAALFYLWLGLFVLFRLLQKFKATGKQAAFVILLIAFGTNLPYFTIIEGSMSHVYSFALINCFLYSLYCLVERGNRCWFVLSAFLLAVIILIRPTNGLVILLIPFFSGGWKKINETVNLLLKKPIYLLSGTVLFLLVMAVQVTIWYIQTGHLIVYSYGDESFNFRHPQFFPILFSYNRGWFVYTPAVFVSLAGFMGLYREFKLRTIWILFFLLVFIYVSSTWWMWYYASKCGQRVFIDIYAIVGLLILFTLKSIKGSYFRYGVISLFLLLTGLNIVQFYQHVKWVFPATYITSEIYWDSFCKFHPEARIYLPQNAITGKQSFSNDMERDMGWMNESTITDADVISGKRSSKIDSLLPFSVGFMNKLSPLLSGKNAIIKINAYVLSKGGKTTASLVVDLESAGKSFCYTPAYLGSFAIMNKWTLVEFGMYVPRSFPPDSYVKIYFYNPSAKIPLFVDDLKIDFLSLKDDENYRRIDGIKIPCF